MKLFDYCYYEDFGSQYYIQVLSFYPKFALIDMCIQWDQYTPDEWIPSLNINIGPCSIGFSFRWRKLGIRFNVLDFDPSDLASYRHNIDNIHAIEQSLFSYELGVAGSVDCIAEYKGELAIIDFKTAKKPSWSSNDYRSKA